MDWHRIWLDSAGDSAALTKHRRRIGRRGRQRDLALHSHFGFSRSDTVPCNSRALCISPLTDSVVATGAAGDSISVLGLRIGQGTGAAPYARDVSTHHRSVESRLTAGSRFCGALRACQRTRALSEVVPADAFFSELATLGFIGALAFLLTYNFDSACDPQEAACSVMQRISLHFLNEGMALQETFEELHFLLFAVSVVYICVVLMLLKVTQDDVDKNVALEKRVCQLQSLAIRARRPPPPPASTQPSPQEDAGAPPTPRDHAMQIWMPEAHGRHRTAAGADHASSAGDAQGLPQGTRTAQLEEPLLTCPERSALAPDPQGL